MDSWIRRAIIVLPGRPYLQLNYSDVMEMDLGLFFHLLDELEDLDLKYRNRGGGGGNTLG